MLFLPGVREAEDQPLGHPGGTQEPCPALLALVPGKDSPDIIFYGYLATEFMFVS